MKVACIPKSLYIGLDIGTSKAKALLMTEKGKVIARDTYEYSTYTSQAGKVEQDAREWLQAAKTMIKNLVQGLPPAHEVRAISISSQGGSLLLADKEGNPLANAIIWQDQRGHKYRQTVIDTLGQEYIHRITGWQLGSELNLLQMLRIRQEQPALWLKADYFLSVADYLSLQLTGRAVLDPANAGINQLLNIQWQSWDEKILQILGIGQEKLPEIIASGTVISPLLPAIARELDLPEQTLLISGGHDQYCAALGAGANREDDLLIGTGTAWVLLSLSSKLDLENQGSLACSRHVVPGLWGNLISLSSGGAALEWVRRALAIEDGNGQLLNLTELDKIISKRMNNPGRPFFYPYLQGCPWPEEHWLAQASFTGIRPEHDRFDLAAAVMEGVVLQVCWMTEAFNRKDKSGRTIMSGGAGRSLTWRQMLADTMNCPIVIPAEPEVGCLGAALLAAAADGVDIEHILRQSKCMSILVQPGERAEMMQDRLKQFKTYLKG